MNQVYIKIKATSRGINGATRRLSPEVLFAKARESMEDTLRELHDRVVNNTPADTGQAREGIYWELNGESIRDLNGVVASHDDYFSVLDQGRRPGSRFPPPDVISEWAERHGIDATAVFPIQRAIARRGIPALHILERSLQESRQHFATIWIRRMREVWRGAGNPSPD